MTGENVELERQYRKNLMIVSMIVLIYSIAGGAFDRDISFSGAKLTFSRPNWIEYFMIVIMLFLQWRHWLVSGSIRRQHRDEVLKDLFLPSRYVRYLTYVFNPGMAYQSVDDNGFAVVGNDECIGRVKIEIVDIFFAFILIKMSGAPNSHDRRELIFLELTNNASRGKGTPHILTSRELEIVRAKYNNDGYDLLSIRYNRFIPFVLLNFVYRVRWFVLSYKEVWFGDSLLPAFVTCAALISYALSKIFS
ncbi:hypothetical protein [Aeromonas jandaei]|uniref:hypothetical protein n=1 Tax=Aeromonas jandaei TaxID=650 RepID=UPI003B9E96AE